jgi:hypothetical protein
MATSRVSITAAFGAAWNRMTTILFRPFDLGKWFALGFTAWLAGLASSGGGGGGSTGWNIDGGSGASADLGKSWERGVEWLFDNPLWLIAGIVGCGLLVAVFLAVLWVSSRGKFMFLDNVVHDRAEVVAPWKRYRRVGNSHFFFQLVFFLALIVLVVGLVVTVLGLAASGWSVDFETPLHCAFLVIAAPLLLLIILAAAYIQYFLDAFVVPLMYRYDLPVMAAWGRFGGVFRRHPAALLLSGLFLLVLALAAGMAILVSGLLTCCLGFLLLIIPYVGTVLILPVPVTYRAFTVELLDQMDPGYFPREGPEATEAPPLGHSGTAPGSPTPAA